MGGYAFIILNKFPNEQWLLYPKQSMYGTFPYICHKNQPNVGKYTIHGWYGYYQPKQGTTVDGSEIRLTSLSLVI